MPEPRRNPTIEIGYVGRGADRSDRIPCDPITQLDVHALGVHVATMPSGSAIEARNVGLTPYLERAHDVVLREHIARTATPGGTSVFVLLVGDSTTGKSRALYEVLKGNEQVRQWPVLRPADAHELNALLDEQRVNSKTILWLNETQKYLYGAAGEKAAHALSRVLEATSQVIVVGAMWSAYFEELARTGRSGDPTAGARELLDGPRTFKVPVPNRIKSDELAQLATLSSTDPRLAVAVATCGEERRVIQHLTGGPELVEAYLNGSLFTQVEHALITVGLEASRLGHQTPVPGALLANAADGYLSSGERPGAVDWARSALLAIVSGVRPDGTRVDFRHLVTALGTYRAHSGQGDPAYEPNAMLDQMTRTVRQGLIGKSELWDALAKFAVSAEDLYRVGISADSRGLYRHAAQMWFRAAAAGHPVAASALLERIGKTDPAAIYRACRWAVKRVNHDDPWSVGCLIREVGAAGAIKAVEDLAIRAIQNSHLDEPLGAAVLIRELRNVGASGAASEVARRAAAETGLHELRDVGYLIRELKSCNAVDGIATLASRIKDVVPDDPASLAALIGELRRAGAVNEVTALAVQAVTRTRLDDLASIASLAHKLAELGAAEAVKALASRIAVEVCLDDGRYIAALIREVHRAQPGSAVAVLATRVAEEVGVGDLENVAKVIHELGISGSKEDVAKLAMRVSQEAYLHDPGSVAEVIHELYAQKIDEALGVLVDRVASSAIPQDPRGLAMLIHELRSAEQGDAVSALAERAKETVGFEDPQGLAVLIRVLRNAKEDDAARVIGIRAGQQAMSDPAHAASVIRELSGAGVDGGLGSAARQTVLSNTRHVAYLLRELRGIGATDDVQAIGARAARESDLDDPKGIAALIGELRVARQDNPVSELAARAAEKVSTYDADSVAILIRELFVARQSNALAQLAERVADTVCLDDSRGVASLIHELNSARARIPADRLAARAAEDVSLDDLWGVHALIRELREMGAKKAAIRLLNRAADSGLGRTVLAEFFETMTISASAAYLRQFGREPNNSPSRRWGWRDLITLERSEGSSDNWIAVYD